MDWSRLRRSLATSDADPPAQAGPSSVGAVLALLAEADGGEWELVYTRRRDDMANHAGQVCFPGGRAEPGESVEAAALREATEEVGLDRGSAAVLGKLPAFWIPVSGYWMQTVVARWHRPHSLTAGEAEVAEVFTVPVASLTDPSTCHVVPLLTGGYSWAWPLGEHRLLWGATALATTALLELVAPGWHGGLEPAALAPERELRPWE
jgi:8-oxo-dGTP pyrophosphatase MutT (NUDIX family)